MTNEKDNIFYLCSLIEFTARKTHNHRSTIVNLLGISGIKKQLHDAPVNHCLSFEQVSDELIDTITNCRYKVPSFLSIGKLYSRIIFDCASPGKEAEELLKLFNSFISDDISDFSNGLYYESPSYLNCSYKSGKLLN